MSSPEPEQEIGIPDPQDEVDAEANGGSSEPEEKADIIAVGWPEGMPTFLNEEYLAFFRRGASCLFINQVFTDSDFGRSKRS